jgi:hypothetical protein
LHEFAALEKLSNSINILINNISLYLLTQKNMPLSPIILFVYSRPVHTLRTLQALALNTLAEQSDLFIFCDGAKANANETTLQKIVEVRLLIRSQQWCKSVTITESASNKGLATSVIEGLTKITNEYGRAIVLEDDIITHKGFLVYMNQALDLYKADNQVFGIAGYALPVPAHLPDTFFLPIVSSWGWATWKRAWQEFENEPQKFINYLKVNQLKEKFNFGFLDNYEILEGRAANKIDSWAVCWYASLFIKKGLYLYPRCSLVSNIGFDGTGTNCDEDTYYATHETTDFVNLSRIAPMLIPAIVQAVDKNLRKHFAPKPLYVRIFNHLKRNFAKKKE